MATGKGSEAVRLDGQVAPTSSIYVVQVQRQAGHAKPSITLDIYSHEFERAKRSGDVRAKIAAVGNPLP